MKKATVSQISPLAASRRKFAAFCLCILASGSAGPSAQAAEQIWSGTNDGVWDTSTLNWDAGTAAWVNTNDALFTGTPTNNVTTATGLTIGSITLDNTFTGSVTMSGPNTVSGATTISGGTLNLNHQTGLGNSAVTVNSGGLLNVTLASDQNVGNVFTGAGTITVSGSTGTPNFNNASALNGFTGTLNVNTSGSKKLALTTAGGNIGSGAIVNIANGATLYIANNSTYSGVTFNLAGAGNSENLGALRFENGTTIGATSSIVATGNTQLGHNGASTASTINAVISESGGSRSIEKVGSGTMVFAGNNTYTGATILTAGTLSVSTDSAGAYNLGGTAGDNGITFNGGALRITGTAMTNFGSHTPTFTATKTVTLDIADAANNFTVSQALNQTTGQMIKLGAGTLTLSGANTYTGGTRANAGTLVLSGSHTKAAGTSDFLSVNNVGAQNAMLKVTAGTHGFTDINLAEAGNSRGAIYQSGGDLSSGSTGGGVGVRVGSGATSYGYYSLSGGTLTNGTADLGVGFGNGATGVMDVTGGSVTTGSWLVLGRNGAGNGLLNVTGGSVTSNSNNIALNWANTAGSISILNVGGGAGAASVTGVSNATNYFDVSQSNTVGTTGVANLLSNGTLTVGRVQSSQAGATALINFNGGTLKATATNSGASFMTSANVDAVTVYSGGGTIDNNGTNITIGNALGAATGNGVTSIAVTNGGSGYIGAPMVKITGGTGNTATGYAVMVDDGTGNGTFKVDSIVITSSGTYSVDPTTVTLTGGGATTAATIGTITTGANTSGGMAFTGAGITTLSGANTYTGATAINGGTAKAGVASVADVSGAFGNNSAVTLANVAGATMDITGFNTQIGSLAGGGATGGNVTLGAATLTTGGADKSGSYAGIISGTGGLTKTGSGTQTLTGANSFTGAVVVGGGTVQLSGTGSVNFSSGITVNSGATFRNNSSVAVTSPVTVNDGTIAGSGTFSVDLGFNSLADTLSPGNSPGILTLDTAQNWSSFTLDWELNDWATQTAGTTYDQVQITSSLTLNSANAYELNILSLTGGNVSGNVPNFSETDRTWIILTTTGGISGFNASNWTLDTSGFTTGSGFTGSFSLTQSGNDLVLNYVIPEPSAYALLGLAGLTLLRRRKRVTAAL